MKIFCRRLLLPAEHGMTIIEVLIALFILSVITSAVLGAVVTGDRIAGRRGGMSCAVTLAKNEAERLRGSESTIVVPGDTAYFDTVNGIVFQVARTRIGSRAPLADSVVLYWEYAISAQRIPQPGPAVTIRLIQGYYGATHR